MALIAIFLTLLFFYILVSQRLERTMITAPIVFMLAGMITWAAIPELCGWEFSRENILTIAEVGLVLLLFTDASRTDWGVFKFIHHLCIRLLGTGMLLTILLGMVIALVIFPDISFWQAGILAAILAPTDPCLGQSIVNSPLVPIRIRQALNVEAGLNDGLAVPFLLFFIAMGSAAAESNHAHLTRFIVEQLGLGSLAGCGIGLLGGWLLGVAHRKQWMAPWLQQQGVVIIPLLCAMASGLFGASMFIAAFVAGLMVQVGFRDVCRQSIEFGENWGQLLNLFMFFVFGVLVAQSLPLFNLPCLLYAVLSLTVVRMLPVALALIGTRLHKATILFMGWFGPRGLGSIVLGLVCLERQSHQPETPTIRLAVIMTVMLSIIAHGLSASPGIRLYTRRIAALPPNAPEFTGNSLSS
ncbi:MAG TPA: cation:proton antiporter [Anaerohalosphaeraceae bacterium]|nr:cation:proton antiporter [Anaerohalosphaeraceae bacterium]